MLFVIASSQSVWRRSVSTAVRGGGQLLDRIDPHRREHVEPRLGLGRSNGHEQAGVEEGGQGVKDFGFARRAADCSRRPRATSRPRRPRGRMRTACSCGLQKIEAPVHRRAQGPLTLGEVDRARRRARRAARGGAQRQRRERPDPGRRPARLPAAARPRSRQISATDGGVRAESSSEVRLEGGGALGEEALRRRLGQRREQGTAAPIAAATPDG